MPTTFLAVKNRAISTLSGDIDDSVTSLSVAGGEGALFPSAYPFHITIDNEILSCTNRSTDTLTVTRHAEGTSATSHSSGAVVSLNITAQVVSDLNTAVNNLESVLPAGSDKSVQFNDGGTLSGDTTLIYDKSTGKLSATQFAGGDFLFDNGWKLTEGDKIGRDKNSICLVNNKGKIVQEWKCA